MAVKLPIASAMSVAHVLMDAALDLRSRQGLKLAIGQQLTGREYQVAIAVAATLSMLLGSEVTIDDPNVQEISFSLDKFAG